MSNEFDDPKDTDNKISFFFLTAVIIAIVVIYNKPFDVETWGTISDWVMVGVTMLTAYYLIQSFNEQKEFNKVQDQINSDQNEFNRVSILPLLFIEDYWVKSGTRTIRLRMYKNSAYNFGVFSTMNDFFVPGKSSNLTTLQNWVEGIGVDVLNVNPYPPSPVDMVFTFEDLSNRLYVQFIRLETNGAVSLSVPRLTTVEKLERRDYT